jgi:hypothetical protein
MACAGKAGDIAFGKALSNALYLSKLESSKRQRFAHFESEDESPEMELFRLYQSNDLVQLQAPDADTLVVIGAPPQQSDQSDNAYEAIARHFARPHKVHSKNLFSLGSARFDHYLGPTRQFRTERLLRNDGILPGGKPSGIKYLLDLRPPSEGEEASFLVTDLSCSSGVLTWFKAQKKYGIPRTMICGQDDSSLLPDPSSDSSHAREQPKKAREKLPTTAGKHAESSPVQRSTEEELHQREEPKPFRIGNWAGVLPSAPVIPDEANDTEVPSDSISNVNSDQESSQVGILAAAEATTEQEPKIQPDYSQLRHRSAIERLLHALEGNDPMLDSAPKMLNFYAIAKYFDCASNERVSGWIATWLFTAPNHHFVQCNPEVCYRIGLGIQSEALIKGAFSLLVGERSLMGVHRGHDNFSVAGRKLECLDDDEVNRIDHATNVFMRRIQAKYEALIGQDMLWLEQSRVFAVLANFVPRSCREEKIAQNLQDYIKAFIRARVRWVLARDYDGNWPEMEQAPVTVRPFYNHAPSHSSIYLTLSEEERIFTRFFWMALKDERFDEGDNSVFTRRPRKVYDARTGVSPAVGWSKIAQELGGKTAESNLAEIQKNELYAEAARFKTILLERHSSLKAQTSQDWSDDEADAGEICAKHDACSGTHTFKAVAPTTEVSTLGHFESLQLSSPKRTRAIQSVTDSSNKKRARLEADGTHHESDHLDGKRSELSIRSAVFRKEGESVPIEEGRTIQVSKLQGLEEHETPGDPFVQVGSEFYTGDNADLSNSRIDQGRRVMVESSRPKTLQQAIIDLADEPHFSIDDLLAEASDAISGLCDAVLLAPHLFRDGEILPTNLIDTLTSLNDAEWKYLPLWAGGNDDGSGGVFEDTEIPILETGGFAGGKRGLSHTGNSSVGGSSDWSEIVSTVGKVSKEAADGTATETATVQSLGDVDMDVKSLEDESSVHDTETEMGLDTSSVYNLGGDSDMEDEDQDEGDIEEDGLRLEDHEKEDAEETGWDDCAT